MYINGLKKFFMILAGIGLMGFSLAKYDLAIIQDFVNSKIESKGTIRGTKVITKLENKLNNSKYDQELLSMLIEEFRKSINQEKSRIIQRESAGEEFKWKKESMFKTIKEFDISLQKQNDMISQFAQYKGKLSDDKMLLEYLKLNDEYQRLDSYNRLYLDISMSTQNDDPQIDEYSQKLDSMYNLFNQTVGFFLEEVKLFDDQKLQELIDNPLFADYSKFFSNLKISRENILPQEQENIISQIMGSQISFSSMYNSLIENDITFPQMKDPNGNTIVANYSNMYSAWNSDNRNFRRDFTEKFYLTYIEFKNILGKIFISNIKQTTVNAKLKNYTSVLQTVYKSKQLSEDVYENLLLTTKNNLSTVHRYRKLKKEYLGLTGLHYYDTFVPIQKLDNSTFTYQQAQDLLLSGLSVLGSDYTKLLKEAFANNWIDVYPGKNKSGGAFFTSTYDFHPLILINFTNSYDAISILAHELGHAINDLYSKQKQPFSLAGIIYPVEVPSITNELLLNKVLANRATDPKVKLFYLDRYLSILNMNFYRSTMYADFEKQVYDLAWKNEPLSYPVLDSIFAKLFKEYYGPSFSYDDYLKIERAIKPHFFTSYYMHEYALSSAAANQVATKILANEPGFLQKYIEYISGGKTGTPNERLKTLGIDMTKPEYLESIFVTQNQIIDEMENLILQIKKLK